MADNSLHKVSERDLNLVTYEQVKEIRVVDTSDNSKTLAINNLTIAGTKVSVAVDGLSGTVDGAFGDVLTAIAEKADTTQVEALDAEKLDIANVYNGLDKTVDGFALDARQGKAFDDVDKANYAKSVEMIAHNATAPSPVIPTGTTKTYEFSSGGLCSWITGGAVSVEKGDTVTATETEPGTWEYTYNDVLKRKADLSLIGDIETALDVILLIGESI
jgi:hypothetical protein